jgi:hypothetical protein
VTNDSEGPPHIKPPILALTTRPAEKEVTSKESLETTSKESEPAANTSSLKEAGELNYYTELSREENDHARSLLDTNSDQLRIIANQGKPAGHVYDLIFLIVRTIEDMGEAIQQAEGQIPVRKDSSDYVARIKDLLKMLVKRYKQTGTVINLQEATFHARKLVEATPLNYPGCPADRIKMMFEKSYCTGLQDDIDLAIAAAVEMDVEISNEDLARGGYLDQEEFIIEDQEDIEPTIYEYESLARNEIRLLELLPGLETDQISIRIHHRLLDNEVDYAALSYTWNNETLSNSVLVDGKTLRITPNLDAALRELRTRPVWFVPEQRMDRLKPMAARLYAFTDKLAKLENDKAKGFSAQVYRRASAILGKLNALESLRGDPKELHLSKHAKVWEEFDELEKDCETFGSNEDISVSYQEPNLLWADAISINQDDVNERNEQIPQMRKIYQQASSLIVWLGLEDAYSRKAFALIQEFRKSRSDYHINSLLPSLSTEEVEWLAIQKLFSRPWFRRSWVLQELVLGSFRRGPNPERLCDAATFCCGQNRIHNLVRGWLLGRTGESCSRKKHRISAILVGDISPAPRNLFIAIQSRTQTAFHAGLSKI